MRKIICALFIVASSLAAAAQQPDAVYKLVRQQWTVNDDGTSDYRYRHEVQILRNRALTAYADKGETFVVYNPELEEVTVNEVYTLQSDGTRVDMPQNAFIYQLPSQCASCARFVHMRELAMVHTGMELGCTEVVDYTVHRRYDMVNETLTLAKECPVEQWEVSVSLPEGQELGVQLNDPELRPFSHTVGGSATEYTLVARNVPQSFDENYMPPAQLLYPTLHFYNGTPAFSPAFNSLGLKESDNIGNQLCGGNQRENVLALRDYVVDNIHLDDIEPARLGYTHATAAEVWQSGCGTATDKAVLLAAMINQMGYRARVVGDNFDEVGVMMDTLEYRLNVREKSPMTLYGKAEDEVYKVNIELNNVEPDLDTLEDGFFRLLVPALYDNPLPNARNLTLVREAPMQGTPCDIVVDLTYTLPKGMKMVGKTVDVKRDFDGMGSVTLKVKQSGSKLRVVRTLKLEQAVVPVNDYKFVRKLIALWQSFEGVLLQEK